MYTLPINFVQNNGQKYKKNIAFKSDITFDIGGSQREGSCKIAYAATKDSNSLYSEDTTVNDLGKTKFKDSNDFIDHLVKKIKKVQKDGTKIVRAQGYNKDENAIKNVTIFLPSYTSKNQAFYLPNHHNINGKPLKDLDFSNLKERLLDNGVKVASDMNFKVVQDAMGTGLAMTKRLYDNGMLEPGKYYTAVITGGGCGVANIEVPDDEKVIIKSTGSRYFVQGLNMQKVSREGASAPAFIENFCKTLGMNEELIDDIKSCHKAEFTTSEECQLPRNVKTERLGKLLQESGKFDVDMDNSDFITTRIKDEYKGRFNSARRNAISKYCLALAGLGSIKKNEGSNGMIITGKFARAIDETARKYYGQGLAEWTMRHMSQSFDSYELEKVQQAAYHFKVICDNRFFIDNNTECGKLAHRAEFINPVRGNWLKISMKELADK